MKVNDIIEVIKKLCPEEYAASWDHTGLQVGNPEQEVTNIVLALDATEAAIEYAIAKEANLLLTHHPLLFSPLTSVTPDTLEGRRVITLIKNGIACYASHTNFDVCCMADEAALRIGMTDGEVFEVTGEEAGNLMGFGKIATMQPKTVGEWAEKIKEIFHLPYIILYGSLEQQVSRIAILPGSGKGMYSLAKEKGAQLLITGDIGHHDALDAVAQGIIILDAGHYGLEHIYMEYLKKYLENACKEKVAIHIFEQGCPGSVL